MKTKLSKIIFSALVSFLGLNAKAAICPCDAPPECGPSRPPSCPLVIEAIKCEGTISQEYIFHQNIDPIKMGVNQPLELTGDAFFLEGSAVKNDEGLVTYGFNANPYCAMSVMVDPGQDKIQGGFEGKISGYECEGEVIEADGVCQLKYVVD